MACLNRTRMCVCGHKWTCRFKIWILLGTKMTIKCVCRTQEGIARWVRLGSRGLSLQVRLAPGGCAWPLCEPGAGHGERLLSGFSENLWLHLALGATPSRGPRSSSLGPLPSPFSLSGPPSDSG